MASPRVLHLLSLKIKNVMLLMLVPAKKPIKNIVERDDHIRVVQTYTIVPREKVRIKQVCLRSRICFVTSSHKFIFNHKYDMFECLIPN